MTKSYEQTASGIIINSIFNYKLKRLVRSLRLPEKQKHAKTAISRKKLSEKSVEGNKKLTLYQKLFCVQLII